VVSLVGEPGTGKTRLLAEFRRRLSASQVTYYAGQCVSYGQAIPYHPVRDILRQLILHTAQPRPLVLAVENLHWCDATSEAWLASLVERLPGATLLLVVTYRPGYQPPWGTHSAATQLALPPLHPQDSRVVVRSILRRTQPPEALLQEIMARAGGNPFFLEELAWHAVDHDGRRRPVTVPETVHAVLAARIDRLAPEAKHLLRGHRDGVAARAASDVGHHQPSHVTEQPSDQGRFEGNQRIVFCIIDLCPQIVPLSCR